MALGTLGQNTVRERLRRLGRLAVCGSFPSTNRMGFCDYLGPDFKNKQIDLIRL